MIQFHGWIVIQETYNDDGYSPELLDSIWKQLQQKVQLLCTEVSDIDIHLNSKNAIYQVSIFSAANHMGYTWEQVYSLIEWISKTAVGSYGLIYVHNDEDIENNNRFIIYCLKKGALYKVKDTLLSPLIPEIEDDD